MALVGHVLRSSEVLSIIHSLIAKSKEVREGTATAQLVEVEVYPVIGQGIDPEKQQINPDAVRSIRDGDSSGEGGLPNYCVVEFSDGSPQRNVKGTSSEVTALLTATLRLSLNWISPAAT